MSLQVVNCTHARDDKYCAHFKKRVAHAICRRCDLRSPVDSAKSAITPDLPAPPEAPSRSSKPKLRPYGWPQSIENAIRGFVPSDQAWSIAARDIWWQIHQNEFPTPQWLAAVTPLLSSGGCGCRRHFHDYLASGPFDACACHNAVRKRQNKPHDFTPEQAKARWRPDGWDYFERVVVINLKSQPERLAKFYLDFPQDWPFRRPYFVEGIDGNTLDQTGFTGGAGACGLHATYLRELRDWMDAKPTRPILFMEDDCAFIDGWRGQVEKILPLIPADADIVYFGGQNSGKIEPVESGLVRTHRTDRTHCFAIYPKFAQRLLEYWTQRKQHVDWTLREIAPLHRFYCIDPYIAYQSAGYSTLMSKHLPSRTWDNRIAPRPVPKSEIVSHAGDVGDLIYGLPAMRAIGASTLVLYPADWTGRRMTSETVEQLKPLLLSQPYIKSVRYAEKPEGFDLNGWRRTYYRYHQNIADRHLNLVERAHAEREKRWIDADPLRVAQVVINRSSWADADTKEWHRLNPKMPWARIVEKYGNDAVFVGLPDEHELFCKTFGAVRYHPTADYLELARVIASCDLFIGNQSCAMALAIAMYKPIVQEVHPISGWQNCLFDRKNAVYVHHGDEMLPELSQHFSQHGEDKWIAENIPLPDRGIFVEVGAAAGLQGSNTLHFERRGWTGLLIEPDPRSLEQLRKNRASAATESCAIGSSPGYSEFVLAPWPEHSGLNRTDGQRITVPLRRLDELLAAHNISQVDLLSIDTEGTELDVWRSIGSLRPKIVIVEWNTVGLPDNSGSLMHEFASSGYRLLHRTPGNLIFTVA